jgi:hypothetical protein
MCSKFKILAMFFFIICLSACYKSDSDWIRVERNGYSISDESPENKQLVLQKTNPGNERLEYTAYAVSKSKGYGNLEVLRIDLEDEFYARERYIRIHTKGVIAYGSYTTVDSEYDASDNAGTVYIEFLQGDYQRGPDLLVYSIDHVSGNVFKFESLDKDYDLLTFEYNANESKSKFQGVITGRFKIRK